MPEVPPRVFISYSHDGLAHQQRVLDLADRLRHDGVDAIIDQYEPFPAEGWPSWCEAEIDKANFVLMVCTPTYRRRVDGKEQPRKGLGVLWEARLIKQHLYDAPKNTKFVPVLFGDGSRDDVPAPVKGYSTFELATAEGYEDLYRLLTDQPRVRKPELGKLRPMRVLQAQWIAEPPLQPQPASMPKLAARCAGGTMPMADFFDGEIKVSDRLKCLQRLPRGPSVDPFLIKLRIKQAFAAGGDPNRAAAIVGEASDLVISALDEPPEDRYTLVIAPSELPIPEHSGLLNYWGAVFRLACLLGPRMVGALLLCAPQTVIIGAKSDIIALFERLEAWK